MLRWFLFTIAFGLLPFGVSVLLQLLSGRAAMVPHSPALLFFAVMICAAQVGAIFSSFLDAQGSHRREILSPLFGVFLLGAVFSAAMYGVYMHHDLNDPGLRWNTSCSRPGVSGRVFAVADFSREPVYFVCLGGRVRGCPGYLV